MKDREWDALIEAQAREIERRLGKAGAFELRCRETDDGCVMGLLIPSMYRQFRKTFLVSGRDADTGEITHAWAENIAAELFMRYMTQYRCWACPGTLGAVSPALSAFFAWCDPDTPVMVHWARWLCIEHESDERVDTFDPDTAEALVEAMIAQHGNEGAVAEAMRRAVRGAHVGERDPNQLELFLPSVEDEG